MAQLAIKGHLTRGKEVIELLEMLEGINSHNLYGDESYAYYTIDSDDEIKGGIYVFGDEELTHFTLEEFEEKFPHKVGDRVKIISTDKIVTITSMNWRNGCEVIYETLFEDDCFECFKADELESYKEETMEETKDFLLPTIDFNEYCKNKYLLDLGNYEIKEENGKIYAVRKQPQYPKTYKECCEVLGCKANDFFTNFGYNGCEVEVSYYEDKIDDLLQSFRKLRYCRDAYWKIAGEQMGLGKPWEPDFTNDDEERYGIYTTANKVVKDFCGVGDVNVILTFPTEEMRDAFYENFKDLIEQCKELL